ncbi:hypothetical protein D9M68_708200 [compost metagenome]
MHGNECLRLLDAHRCQPEIAVVRDRFPGQPLQFGIVEACKPAVRGLACFGRVCPGALPCKRRDGLVSKAGATRRRLQGAAEEQGKRQRQQYRNGLVER